MKKLIMLLSSLVLIIAAVIMTFDFSTPRVKVGRSYLHVTDVDECANMVNALVNRYHAVSGSGVVDEAADCYNSAYITFDVGQYANDTESSAASVLFGNSSVGIYVSEDAIFSKIETEMTLSATVSGKDYSSSARLKFELLSSGEQSNIRISRFDVADGDTFFGLFEYFTDRWLDCEELEDLADVALQIKKFYKESRTMLAGIQMYREWLDILSTTFHPYLTNKEQFLQWVTNLGDGDFACLEALRNISTYCTQLSDSCIDQLEELKDTYLSDIEFGMYQHTNQIYYLTKTPMSSDELRNNVALRLDFTNPSAPLLRYSDIHTELIVRVSGVDSVVIPDINRIKTSSVGSRLNIN